MNKKNLIDIFTKDTSYNYHIIKTNEPDGHLLYLMKNGSKLKTDSLEFTTTLIAEELIKECDIKIEKIAPAVYFTEEYDTEKLKYKLNNKLSETKEFSKFIESIKISYRILEIKDALLYKKDPDAYKEKQNNEYNKKQSDLWEKLKEQFNQSKKAKEKLLLSYNDNLTKLLKEYFSERIYSERQELNFNLEFENIIQKLIDTETWLKIDGKDFSCIINPISLNDDTMLVYLTNNTTMYTASLRLDKTKIVAENFNKIESEPKFMSDYEFLSILYNVETSIIDEWEFKNDSERFKYIIDIIFKYIKDNKDKN